MSRDGRFIWWAAMPFLQTHGHELADCHSADAFHRYDANRCLCGGVFIFGVALFGADALWSFDWATDIF
jgi:hypothetical protein